LNAADHRRIYGWINGWINGWNDGWIIGKKLMEERMGGIDR
jgi:hypothetical protein